jgi:uncharacterized membrane protein
MPGEDKKTKKKTTSRKKKTTTVKKKTTAKNKTIKNNTRKSDNMANEKDDNKILLFITYLIGVWSIIIYLIKKDDSNIKYHCLQSIVLNIVIFAIVFVILILGSIFTMVLGALTAGIGGICGVILFPLAFLPAVYYLYVYYMVLTTGDIEVPYITEFVKKSLKQYY